MYDSDGGGFFAIGILMMAAVYGFVKVFLDNILWFFLVMAIFAGGLWFYMRSGIDVQAVFGRWWQGHVNRILIKLFGVGLSNKYVWPIYAFLSIIIRMGISFYALILGLYFAAFLIDKI